MGTTQHAPVCGTHVRRGLPDALHVAERYVDSINSSVRFVTLLYGCYLYLAYIEVMVCALYAKTLADFGRAVCKLCVESGCDCGGIFSIYQHITFTGYQWTYNNNNNNRSAA